MGDRTVLLYCTVERKTVQREGRKGGREKTTTRKQFFFSRHLLGDGGKRGEEALCKCENGNRKVRERRKLCFRFVVVTKMSLSPILDKNVHPFKKSVSRRLFLRKRMG